MMLVGFDLKKYNKSRQSRWVNRCLGCRLGLCGGRSSVSAMVFVWWLDFWWCGRDCHGGRVLTWWCDVFLHFLIGYVAIKWYNLTYIHPLQYIPMEKWKKHPSLSPHFRYCRGDFLHGHGTNRSSTTYIFIHTPHCTPTIFSRLHALLDPANRTPYLSSPSSSTVATYHLTPLTSAPVYVPRICTAHIWAPSWQSR